MLAEKRLGTVSKEAVSFSLILVVFRGNRIMQSCFFTKKYLVPSISPPNGKRTRFQKLAKRSVEKGSH